MHKVNQLEPITVIVLVLKKQIMKRFNGVLIVDDDPISNYMTKGFFSRMDSYNYVSFCRNGKEALRFLQKNKDNLPDLILLELQLPFMDGYALLEKLTEEGFDRKQTKIVLYTINSKEISKEQKKYGLELIDKPLTAEKFYHVIGTENTIING